MKTLQKLDKWHHTGLGLFIFGVVELGIAYGFASLAIDRGSLWWYLLAAIFFIGGLKNLVQIIGVVLYGKRHAN
jgi:hypothetical protein